MASADEFDIDVGSYMRTLARHWWLILALAAVGACTGVAVTYLQEKTYDATAAVYLGQATDATGAAIAGPTSNPRAAAQIVQSERSLRRAAAEVGMGETVKNLRSGLRVVTPSVSTKSTTAPTNFINITVADTRPARAASAATALADILLEETSAYADDKISLFKRQIASNDAELARLAKRSAKAQDALEAIAAGAGSKADKAMASAPYLAIVESVATARQPLLKERRSSQLMLLVAEDIEKPQLLHEAVAPGAASGPSLQLNAAVGLLVGLVVGIIAAFVIDGRRRHAAAQG